MRVRGDFSPSGAFTLEDIPKKPGMLLARFYENAHEFSEVNEGLTSKGWEWDEYHMELASYPGIESDIAAGYAAYTEQAKALETESNKIPTLEEKQAQTRADVEYIAMMAGVDL